MAHFINYDKKFIPYGILHYYSSGQTCEEVVASLLRSHEKNPKLFPRVHAQEVEFWYDSFKNENYDFSQSPTVAPHTKLENLPVLHHVFHGVNAADQQSLLKTCKQFKHMIEEEKRLFEHVEFRMSNNSVMLQVTCGIKYNKIRTVYKKNGDGCIIIKDKKHTKSEKDFMTAALYDFSKTVEMIHTKVKKLTVKYGEYKVAEVDRVRFMTGVSGILSSLKEKLHVEDLEMSCHEPHELESILQTLKLGVLTKLDFSTYRKEEKKEERREENRDEDSDEDSDADSDDEEEDEPVFKIKDSQIFKEHLPHFKSLSHTSETVDLKLEDFAHVPRVYIQVAEITPEEVKAHREKLLQSPNFDSHQIYDSLRFRGYGTTQDQELARAMEPYKKITKDFEEFEDEQASGYIPYEDGTEDLLHFDVTSFKITFSRRSKKRWAFMRLDGEMEVEDEGEEEDKEE
ncbi:unnamed protein product [Caenorhabditis brenneri]